MDEKLGQFRIGTESYLYEICIDAESYRAKVTIPK